MRKIILAGALFLSLSGCSWASDTVEKFLPTCENKVLSITAAITASGIAAHQYTGLPLCGSKNALPGKFCSDITIVRTIQSAENTAHIAVKAAQRLCSGNALDAARTASNAYGDIAEIFKPKP